MYTPFQPKTNDLIIAFIGYNLLKHASSSEKRRHGNSNNQNAQCLCTSSCLFTCNVLQQKQRLVLGAGWVGFMHHLLSLFLQWFCLQLHCIDFPYFLVRVDGWWKLAFGWCRHDLIPPQGDTPSVCTRSYCISYQGLCIMIFVTMNTSTSNTDPWIQTHNWK